MAIDVRQRALAGGAGSALAYRLGTTRRFGLTDIGLQGQIRGWAQPEEGHSWNDGVEVVMDLVLPAKPCTITLRGSPYCPRVTNRQDVTLFGNGFRLGFWRLSSTSSDTLSAMIEPEQWFRRGDAARLSCLWFLPNSARPVDLGEVDDQRELGFCFRTLLIAEAEG